MAFATELNDLPQELLPNILKFLPLADNVRFGAVCSDWYSVAANNPHPLAPQPPFLLFAGKYTGDRKIFQFLDLSVNKLYNMYIPQLCNRWCIGSSEGKLIYMGDCAELYVLDPVTRSHFDLPSITTFPEVGVGDDPYCYPKVIMQKVIICPRTSAVAVLRDNTKDLAFCLPDDRTWTVIQNDPTATHSTYRFMDVAFYKGGIYGTTYKGEFVSYKIDRDTTKFKLLTPLASREHPTRYLVEVDGELLQVCIFYHPAKHLKDTGDDGGSWPNRMTHKFRLHKMNWGTTKWEAIESIGEYALFLGFNTSFSLSTRGHHELKANNIYLTGRDFIAYVVHCSYLECDLAVFNLEDGTIEPYYLSGNGLKLTCSLPIWFIPKVVSNFFF